MCLSAKLHLELCDLEVIIFFGIIYQKYKEVCNGIEIDMVDFEFGTLVIIFASHTEIILRETKTIYNIVIISH